MNHEKVANIRGNLKTIHDTISKIKNKITKTEDSHSKININKVLVDKTSNSNLVFQINILKTDYLYYTSIQKLILEKFSQDIQEILNNITNILSLLKKLEFDLKDKKIEILNKIKKENKQDKVMNYSMLNEKMDIIVHNIPIVDEYLTLFDNYIKETKTKHQKENIHSEMYELDIFYKKEKIKLEYNKNCDTFKNTLEYFEKITNLILKNIDNSELLNLCL